MADRLSGRTAVRLAKAVVLACTLLAAGAPAAHADEVPTYHCDAVARWDGEFLAAWCEGGPDEYTGPAVVQTGFGDVLTWDCASVTVGTYELEEENVMAIVGSEGCVPRPGTDDV